jgi:ribonuclease P protein component
MKPIITVPFFSFRKEERLKSRKAIEQLFNKGNSFHVYPLRLVWCESNEKRGSFPVQFSLSVSKKAFKSAVIRNRIKRKVREAWRLNKPKLYMDIGISDRQFDFMIIYTSREELTSLEIHNRMRKIIAIFLKKYRSFKPGENMEKDENQP